MKNRYRIEAMVYFKERHSNIMQGIIDMGLSMGGELLGSGCGTFENSQCDVQFDFDAESKSKEFREAVKQKYGRKINVSLTLTKQKGERVENIREI